MPYQAINVLSILSMDCIDKSGVPGSSDACTFDCLHDKGILVEDS